MSSASYNRPLGTETSRALHNFLQEWIVGISGTPSDLVRPRWQPEPPPRPEVRTKWIAFGLTGLEHGNSSPYQEESPPGTEPANLQWVERLQLLLSFYGPEAMLDAMNFRNTAYVEMNRYPLVEQNVRLQRFGDITPFPELVNEVWYMRADLPMTLERSTVRAYQKTQAVGVTTSLHDSAGGTVDVKIGTETNGKPQS